MENDIRVKASRYTKMLWDEWLLRPVDSRYNIGFIYHISGNLNLNRLKKALGHYINQNPIIRSYFHEKDGYLYQILKARVSNGIDVRDYSGRDQKQIDALLRTFCEYSFNLDRAPLFKFTIVKAGDARHYLVLRFHHIIIDGTSAEKIPEEIARYYNAGALDLGQVEAACPELASYLEFEDDFFATYSLDEGLEFWGRLLGRRTFHTSLPENLKKPEDFSFAPTTLRFRLEEELTSKLVDLAQHEGCTMFQVMAALWSILLQKYANKESIALLYPVSLRPRHLCNLKGYLVNSLPMIVDFSPASTFLSVLQAVKEQRNNSKPYQHIPFDRIIARYNETSPVHYGLRFNNAFNATIVESNELMDSPIQFKGLSTQSIPSQTMGSSDLHLMYKRDKGFLECKICYDHSRLDASVFDSVHKQFMRLVERLLAAPRTQIDSLSLLSDVQFRQVVHDWNRTEAPYPENKTVHALFEAQAARTPDNLAVVFKDRRLTYRQLNLKANQLAHTIRREYKALCGSLVQNDTPIGLYTGRGPEMIIGILGILKSGAAYVPFDLADPDERLKFKIKDCGCRMILTTSDFREDLVYNTQTNLLALDACQDTTAAASRENPEPVNTPDDLAYIIYTSGSTGRPKGVMTRHRDLVNFIHYHTQEFSTARPYHKVTQSISINFDASWTELALGLFNGATLHIIESIAQMTGPELAAYLHRHGITIFTSTPAIVNNLPKEPVPGLEYLICGGDVGSKSTMDYWSRQLKYYNAYGPTEATVCTAYSLHNSGKSNRNIGTPLHNKKIYILSGKKSPAPIGVYGELYIGGEGLAAGYLNRPDLTDERFVDNPFATEDEKRAGRNLKMYKTGDLARWLPDGSIEFSRRNDDQVKISGFRVELGEIENKLMEYPAVSQCAVICRERKGNQYLAAYHVAGKRITEEQLEQHLSGVLPYYMVPSYFIQLTSMPLTVGGKIDRKNLPEPDFTGDGKNYIAPRNETEIQLCRLWQEALGIERVGINDDFFHLGGTSITAMKLSHRMTRSLKREIPVASIFTRKSVRGISEALADFKQLVEIEPCRDDTAVLSFAQERLLFIEEYQGAGNAYNIPMLFELAGEADIPALKKAIQSIIKRHEILRTVFVRADSGDFYQKLLEKPPAIEEINTVENKLLHEAGAAANEGFDLHTEHPVRVVFFNTGTKAFLLITIHHIAFDGWSADLFLNELENFYHYHTDGIPPAAPDLDIQYRDFAAWQRRYLSGERLDRALAYWKQELDGYETLYLPLDKPRPPQVQYAGDDIGFTLDRELSTQLKLVTKEYGTTPFTVFLAAFNILLHKLSGQTDLVVGSPTANRQVAQLDSLIGFFVNSIPMRCRLSPDLHIAELVEKTGYSLAGMQEFQDLPFEKLIDALKVEQDPSRHPLFQVMFGVQSFGESLGSEGLEFLKAYDTSQIYNTAKFDLSLFINDAGQTITGSFNYAVSLFNRETIEGMVGHYRDILKVIASGKAKRIQDISLLSASDLYRITGKWNDTACLYPHDKTIAQAFEDQAAGTPDSPALAFDGNHLTYRELNSRANRFAHTIKNAFCKETGKEITADTLIGLYMEPCFDMFTAILGILKAGAAYVPFDPDDPRERLKFKIRDCGCKMVLTDSGGAEDLVFLAGNRIVPFVVDDYRNEIEKSPGTNPEPARQSRDLAYVIYTSGSTGSPKGVMIEHYGVINLTESHQKSFAITGESTILQLASISFDASVSTLFCALLNGARLLLCDRESRRDTRKLAQLIEKEAVTHIDITPRLLELLPRDLDAGRLEYVITAGEVCDMETMAHWCAKLRVINAYGPTEATVCTTFAEYAPGMSNHNIGKPMANKKVYVLDKALNPVPVGSPGELYIGGHGLARGYLNRPGLTGRRFLPNPFLGEDNHHPLENRIYKTGDMVRWVNDGSLEFIGRNDDQVKMAGFRIEPGEIENSLASMAGITGCMVTLNQREQIRYLCAYYTGDRDLSADEIRAHLAGSLPEYMIPSCFVKLAKFPLNTSGKIDRHSLPDPDLTGDPHNFSEPRNETEAKLCQLWKDILGVDKIGIDDDFFRFGGNSILAIKLSHRMSQILGREVAVVDIFKNRTINGFSLAGDLKGEEPEGEVVEL